MSSCIFLASKYFSVRQTLKKSLMSWGAIAAMGVSMLLAPTAPAETMYSLPLSN